MSGDSEKSANPVERAARDTIDNLVNGRVHTQTIRDVKNAADRALQDRSAGSAIGRATTGRL